MGRHVAGEVAQASHGPVSYTHLDVYKRQRLTWFNLALTKVLMVFLIFGGVWVIPKMSSAILFEIGFATARPVN